jgi:hypothetical protein
VIAPGVPFEQIGENDLRPLIENSYSERQTVEYKRQLPSTNDAGKRKPGTCTACRGLASPAMSGS